MVRANVQTFEDHVDSDVLAAAPTWQLAAE
jgi:hypothetical protein